MLKKILIFGLKRPLMALAVVILTGGALTAGVSLLTSGGEDSDLPVIQAESRPFKIVPQNRGGTKVANQDTTVFNTLRSPNNFSVIAGKANTQSSPERPVENLLNAENTQNANRQAAQKLAVFSDQVEEIIDQQQARTIEDDINQPIGLLAQRANNDAPGSDASVNITETIAAIEPASGQADPQEKVQPVKTASVTPKPMAKPKATKKLQQAGTSPETLAFVRSVLDAETNQQLSQDDAAKALAMIEPAAGAAATAAKVSGDAGYFVQLASVTSEAAAHKAWPKYESLYSSVTGTPYRVQEANLGQKGIYYRIQAGPFSKELADQKCAAIKAQKPGGCLVVKQ